MKKIFIDQSPNDANMLWLVNLPGRSVLGHRPHSTFVALATLSPIARRLRVLEYDTVLE